MLKVLKLPGLYWRRSQIKSTHFLLQLVQQQQPHYTVFPNYQFSLTVYLQRKKTNMILLKKNKQKKNMIGDLKKTNVIGWKISLKKLDVDFFS